MNVVVIQHLHFPSLSESFVYHVHYNWRILIHVECVQNRAEASFLPEIYQYIYVVYSLVYNLAKGLVVLHSLGNDIEISFWSNLAQEIVRIKVKGLVLWLNYHSRSRQIILIISYRRLFLN